VRNDKNSGGCAAKVPLLLYKISQPGEFFIGQGWVVVERQLRHQRVLIFRQFVQKNLLSRFESFALPRFDHLFDDHVAYANVDNSLEQILNRSEIVKNLFSKGEIGIIGGVYGVDTGKVDFFKNLTNNGNGYSQSMKPKMSLEV